MKKFYLVLTFAIAIAVVGCSKQENNSSVADVKCTELSVGLPHISTRPAIDDAGKATWTDGDTFALWAVDGTGQRDIDAAKFTMYYYWQTYDYAVFTANNVPVLEAGDYTYYATAPMPASTSGLTSTYNLSSEQAADAFNSAYDIMVATPLIAEAITPDNTVNYLGLDFAHKMHTLKVSIAENKLGSPISALRFTFPTNVTGTVTVDAANPTAAPTLSNGSTTLNLNLATAINAGSGAAWGVIFPTTIEGDVKVTAVGTDGRLSKEKTVNINKTYAEGHLTPLSFSVPVIRPTLRFSIGNNYLGEPVQKLTIADHNGDSVTFDVNEQNRYDFTIDSDFTDTVFDHYEGKTFTATFESKNAIVSTTFVMPAALTAGLNVIPAIDVPYLLFEDFSCIHTEAESYGDNTLGGNVTGGATDERKQPGSSLDSYMSHTGWNAARFMLGVGTCPRINMRSQVVKVFSLSWGSSHYGRLDTPPLSRLKSGASVKLNIQFDSGGVEYEGASGDVVGINMATHTNSANPIDGIPTGKNGVTSEYSTTLNDFGTTVYAVRVASNYTVDSFGSTFPTHTVVVNKATNATRLVFYPTTAIELDSIDNCESAIYIDNIKVSIVYEPDEE